VFWKCASCNHSAPLWPPRGQRWAWEGFICRGCGAKLASNWKRRRILLLTVVPATFLLAGTLWILGYRGGTALVVILFNIAQLVYSVLDRPRLIAPGPFCTACAYDLSAVPAGSPCPECGRAPEPIPS
jgi:hypothetical protein